MVQLKDFMRKVVLRVLKAQIPRLTQWLLSLFDVDYIVEQIKPFIEAIQAKLPDDYRPQFKALLKKIAEIFNRLGE